MISINRRSLQLCANKGTNKKAHEEVEGNTPRAKDKTLTKAKDKTLTNGIVELRFDSFSFSSTEAIGKTSLALELELELWILERP